MKTRIKVIERANGAKEYIAQYRVMWWEWRDFLSHGPAHMKAANSLAGSPKAARCTSLEFAQAVIDAAIELENHEKASQIEKKIKNTDYLNYP